MNPFDVPCHKSIRGGGYNPAGDLRPLPNSTKNLFNASLDFTGQHMILVAQ